MINREKVAQRIVKDEEIFTLFDELLAELKPVIDTNKTDQELGQTVRANEFARQLLAQVRSMVVQLAQPNEKVKQAVVE